MVPGVNPGAWSPLGASLTFQAEDPVPQGIHDVFQGCLVRHVEEMLVVRVTGDGFDFV